MVKPDCKIKCVGCGGEQCRLVGDALSDSWINFQQGTRRLYECAQCDLWFKEQSRNNEALENIYTELPGGLWANDPQTYPKFVQWVFDDLKKQGSINRILDVGCSDGSRLKLLNTIAKRDGVEPSTAAREGALKNGIERVYGSLDEVTATGAEYDSVLAFDVIEHVADPTAFLRSMIDLTRNGGSIYIFTGDRRTLLPSLFRSYYWYIQISMHEMWFSKTWFQRAANMLPVELSDYVSFRSADVPMKLLWRGIILAVIYALLQNRVGKVAVTWLLRSVGKKGVIDSMVRPPWIEGARDHALIKFVKRGSHD